MTGFGVLPCEVGEVARLGHHRVGLRGLVGLTCHAKRRKGALDGVGGLLSVGRCCHVVSTPVRCWALESTIYYYKSFVLIEQVHRISRSTNLSLVDKSTPVRYTYSRHTKDSSGEVERPT